MQGSFDTPPPPMLRTTALKQSLPQPFLPLVYKAVTLAVTTFVTKDGRHYVLLHVLASEEKFW